MSTNHQICTVIPPHMWRHVATAGDEETRLTARATLVETRNLIEQRQHRTLIEPAAKGMPVCGKQRKVYDARHHRTLPGTLVRSEGSRKSGDAEADQAFDGSGVVVDFYQEIFDRLSIDGKGMPVESTVHYGTRFDNAMWNGEQMVYGDGDGKLFKGFTPLIDVTGHELTHGVTQYSAGLEYFGQTGALNEHISDAFGIMVKQYKLRQTADQSSWLIGEGIFAKGVKGKAIRSMAAPGTAYDDPRLGRDPQPAHMRRYVETSEDNGGVHINSGIPNHAFYLAAKTLGGETWPVLGSVWYATLTTRLSSNATFRDFAQATVAMAGDLYGHGGTVQGTVAAAWGMVGLPVRSSSSSTRRRPSVSKGWRRSAAAAPSTEVQEKGESK